MRRPSLWLGAIAIIVLTIPLAVRGQSDPRSGTWKLDLAKSKYVPGPPPSSEVRVYVVQGHMMQVSIESTDARGHQTSLRYTAGDNGQDYPLSGLTIADSIAVKRIDSHTFVMDTKKNGNIIGTSKAAISKDGKTLTLTSETHSSDGTLIRNVAVYEKQ